MDYLNLMSPYKLIKAVLDSFITVYNMKSKSQVRDSDPHTVQYLIALTKDQNLVSEVDQLDIYDIFSKALLK